MGHRAAALAWACAAVVGLAACTDDFVEVGKGGAGAAGLERVDAERVRGKVNAVYPASLMIEDSSGRWHVVQIAPDTTVRSDGRASSLLELREGVHVEVRGVRQGTAIRAAELHVVRSR